MTIRTVEALKELLGSKPGVSVHSYDVDFDTLWNFDLTTSHQIVVWADTPADPKVYPISTERHLTPFDWALVARSRDENLRVTVLNLRPVTHAGYPALRWLEALKPECVPWLRRLTVADLMDITDADGLRRLLSSASVNVPHASPVQIKPLDALKVLQAGWADIRESLNHHAIANLVGPLVLADELCRQPGRNVPSGEYSPHQRAMYKVVQAIRTERAKKEEIGPTEEPPQEPPPDPPPPRPSVIRREQWSPDVFRRYSTVRFLMVDDQSELGYRDVVRDLLWSDPKVKQKQVDGRTWSLDQHQSPAALLDHLEATVRQILPGEVEAPRDFCAAIGSDAKPLEFDILLLDLRLFVQRDEEYAFFERVAQIGKLLLERAPEDPAHLAELVDAAESRGNEGRLNPRALALLPALISTVDPSLPIVLFSSTQQRAVTDALATYPNVVTGFGKPRIGSYADDSCIEALDRALQAALKLHQRRAAWLRLCQIKDWGALPAFYVVTESAGPKENSGYNHPDDALEEGAELNLGGYGEQIKNRGSLQPDLVGSKLCKRLGTMYLDLILPGAHPSLRSEAYTIVEGCIRAALPEGIRPRRLGGTVEDAKVNIHECLDPRNFLMAPLRRSRNRHSHGDVLTARSAARITCGEEASIGVFLLLLEFVDYRTGAAQSDDWDRWKGSVKDVIKQNRRGQPIEGGWVKITGNFKIPWPKLFLYSLFTEADTLPEAVAHRVLSWSLPLVNAIAPRSVIVGDWEGIDHLKGKEIILMCGEAFGEGVKVTSYATPAMTGTLRVHVPIQSFEAVRSFLENELNKLSVKPPASDTVGDGSPSDIPTPSCAVHESIPPEM